MTSAHDVTNHYTDDTRLVRRPPARGGLRADPDRREQLHDASTRRRRWPARNAETGYRRGGGKTYAFAFECQDLERPARDAVRSTSNEDGDQLASFRFDVAPTEPPSRSSRWSSASTAARTGADLRPRLVLFLEGETTGQADAPRECDPGRPRPVIAGRRRAAGPAAGRTPPRATPARWSSPGAPTCPSDSTVLFRPVGSSEPFTQVGSDSLTTVHAVQVFGLDPDVDYVFGVRSTTCNGLTTTDDNGGDGLLLRARQRRGGRPPTAGRRRCPTEDVLLPRRRRTTRPTRSRHADGDVRHDASPTGEPPVTQARPCSRRPRHRRRTRCRSTGAPTWATTPRAIVGDVTFDWWFSTPNAAGVASASTVDVNVFSDPDDAVARRARAGRASPSAPQPAEFQHGRRRRHRAPNPVDDELRRSRCRRSSSTPARACTAHYDADSMPSGFTLPLGAGSTPPRRARGGHARRSSSAPSTSRPTSRAGRPSPVPPTLTMETNEWVRPAPGTSRASTSRSSAVRRQLAADADLARADQPGRRRDGHVVQRPDHRAAGRPARRRVVDRRPQRLQRRRRVPRRPTTASSATARSRSPSRRARRAAVHPLQLRSRTRTSRRSAACRSTTCSSPRSSTTVGQPPVADRRPGTAPSSEEPDPVAGPHPAASAER